MEHSPTILFLSHGGGPLPLLGDAAHAEMVDCLKGIASEISKPSAILVISAHWEANVPTITSGAKPNLIYDYYGFPEESYAIEYPCPGEPSLAKNIYEALSNCGFDSELHEERGLDHGVFVPLKIMFPAADIPCVQLSLLKNMDPEQHLKIGEALRTIEYENLLVIGSGFSFHNLKAFFAPDNDQSKDLNESFESWLIGTCTNLDLSDEQRQDQLKGWSKAPGARFCHPREEHLLPLHVCYGLAGRPCSKSYRLTIMNKLSSMYLWT